MSKNLRELAARNTRRLASVGLVAGTLLSGSAMAAGTDFSAILAGVDGTTAATALVGAAAILAIVGFAKWGAKKVGGFFG